MEYRRARVERWSRLAGPLLRAVLGAILALTAARVTAGTAVAYTVAVTNRDSASCGTASIALAPGVPAGWTAVLASAVLSIAPGATASTTLTVTSPAAAAEAFYTVSVTATGTAPPNLVGSGPPTRRATLATSR